MAPAAVALVHDYLTQRGGAERVALAFARAFPGAALYTSLYDPGATFPEFEDVDVRTLPIDRIAPLRRNHRLALPLLAAAFSKLEIDAGVVLCSSSGWAHGTRTTGRKVVYCHTPARWLYQPDVYLGVEAGLARRLVLRATRRHLLAWDVAAAATADRYLACSSIVRERIAVAYGIDATVVPPPASLAPDEPLAPVDGLEPGYFLCVSRLLPYKNVDAVVDAFAGPGQQRLAVVGQGPDEARLRERASARVTMLGSVTDAQLRWLYENCFAVVAASYEDFGLTPIEGASFGKPTVALRWGGFLDSIVDGTTGLYFDRPTREEIAAAVECSLRPWEREVIRAHALQYSEARFIERIQGIVDEQAA